MTALSFFMPWEFSLLYLVAFLSAAFFYARGPKQKPWQQICFWLGFLSLYFALQTHFDYWAEHEFFLGRIQQAIVQHFGTFLIALALPWASMRQGSPKFFQGFCDRCKKVLNRAHVDDLLLQPAPAALIFTTVIAIWLVPSVQFLAMLDVRLYDLMNWSMILSGLLFWCVAFNPNRSAASRIAMVLAVIPLQIALGLVLVFARHPLYPVYSICGYAFGGVSPLQDQQIGGSILWVHGAMMSVIAALLIGTEKMRGTKG